VTIVRAHIFVDHRTVYFSKSLISADSKTVEFKTKLEN